MGPDNPAVTCRGALAGPLERCGGAPRREAAPIPCRGLGRRCPHECRVGGSSTPREYTDDALGPHGVLEPGRAFLQKPLAPDDLAERVRELLDGWRAEAAPRE
jgi:hypothetical protein